MTIFVDIFGGHHKTGLFLGVNSMHLRSRYRMGIFWGVDKISNIILGMPDIPDTLFFGKQ